MHVDPVTNSLLHLFSAISGTSPLHRATTAARPTSSNAPSAPGAPDIVSRLPKDSVEISSKARAAAHGQKSEETNPVGAITSTRPGQGEETDPVGTTTPTHPAQHAFEETGKETAEEGHGPTQLTPEQQEQVRELQQRDREVRTHENAHLAAGGSAVQGGPTFTYQSGPDGRQYAVGGEVSIQPRANSDDPEERIRHAELVRRAALAPGEPSPQDRSVAAAASQEIARATAELRTQQGQADKQQAANPNTLGSLFGQQAPTRGLKIDIAV